MSRLKSLAPIVALVAAAGTIGSVRWRLSASVLGVKESSDAYALPAPEQIAVASLGYRAAAADLIWAYILVSQGLHATEHRRFDHAARYFRSIIALDPVFREPYMMVDTVLTFGSVRATTEATRETREMLEIGVAQRPLDAELIWQAGSFIAYIAPSYIPEDERSTWEIAGAKLLTRAAELGLKRGSSMAEMMAGASLLKRHGQREAAKSALERALDLTDDEPSRAQITAMLATLGAQAEADRASSVAQRFGAAWRGDLPFVSRSRYLLLAPPIDPYACAGPRPRLASTCALDWRTWIERATGPQP